MHADASKRKAVSYKRLAELEAQLRTEVEELFALSEQSEQPEVLDGLVVSKEIARRLARLAEAKVVLEARAKEWEAAEQAEYEAKLEQRKEREHTTGRRPGGRSPTSPTAGPRAGDQYNFTDPQSRIMKSSTHAGFEQDYNAQVAVDQQSLLIVGCTLSNHSNDSQEAEPTLAAIPWKLGTPEAARWMLAILAPPPWPPVPSVASSHISPRAVIPIIRVGNSVLPPLLDPPSEDATPQVQMAYKLKTAVGKAIYGARKCTVEPVIGIIKEVLGFPPVLVTRDHRGGW